MDVADLRVVDAVARHGSMNKAASELNTVQSNVSRDGLVAVHDLSPELAHVQTVFVRRIDGYYSSALATFLHSVRQDAVSAPALASVAL